MWFWIRSPGAGLPVSLRGKQADISWVMRRMTRMSDWRKSDWQEESSSKQEGVGRKRAEVRDQRSEVRDQRSKIRNQVVRSKEQNGKEKKTLTFVRIRAILHGLSRGSTTPR